MKISFDTLIEQMKKEGKTFGNPNLKPEFFMSTVQPGIVWKPVEAGKHYECFLCGVIATSFHIKADKKIFSCTKCFLKY